MRTAVAITAFGGLAASLMAETINLPAIIASPRGIYSDLRTTGNIFVGAGGGTGMLAVGTANPSARLHIVGGSGLPEILQLMRPNGNAGLTLREDSQSVNISHDGATDSLMKIRGPNHDWGRPFTVENQAGAVNFHLYSYEDRYSLVSIGSMTEPQARVDIRGGTGTALVVRSGGGTPRFTVQDTGTLTGAGFSDVAENLAVRESEDRPVEPGDVMVVDPDHDEQMTLSQRPYDRSVLGVVSTQPGYLLAASEVGKPLALAGRVPTKATTENGPIRRGDLLVTSSKPGYAMRGDATKVKPGMAVGTALEDLRSGEGTVVALVSF